MDEGGIPSPVNTKKQRAMAKLPSTLPSAQLTVDNWLKPGRRSPETSTEYLGCPRIEEVESNILSNEKVMKFTEDQGPGHTKEPVEAKKKFLRNL